MRNPNQPATGNLSRRIARSRIAQAGLVGGIVVGYLINQNSAYVKDHIDQALSHIHGNVGKGSISPLTLTARSVMYSDADASVRTIKKAGAHIPFTHIGFDTDLAGTGRESHIVGQTRTIAFIRDGDTTITNGPGKGHKTVHIRRSDIRYDTTFVEKGKTTTNELPPVSSMGDGISKFVDGATNGIIPLFTNRDIKAEASLNQWLSETTINKMQEVCGAQAEQQTEKSIRISYQLSANQAAKPWAKPWKMDVVFDDSKPVLTGPYENALKPYDIASADIQNVSCHVDPSALIIKPGDLSSYHPNELKAPQRQKN